MSIEVIVTRASGQKEVIPTTKKQIEEVLQASFPTFEAAKQEYERPTSGTIISRDTWIPPSAVIEAVEAAKEVAKKEIETQKRMAKVYPISTAYEKAILSKLPQNQVVRGLVSVPQMLMMPAEQALTFGLWGRKLVKEIKESDAGISEISKGYKEFGKVQREFIKERPIEAGVGILATAGLFYGAGKVVPKVSMPKVWERPKTREILALQTEEMMVRPTLIKREGWISGKPKETSFYEPTPSREFLEPARKGKIIKETPEYMIKELRESKVLISKKPTGLLAQEPEKGLIDTKVIGRKYGARFTGVDIIGRKAVKFPIGEIKEKPVGERIIPMKGWTTARTMRPSELYPAIERGRMEERLRPISYLERDKIKLGKIRLPIMTMGFKQRGLQQEMQLQLQKPRLKQKLRMDTEIRQLPIMGEAILQRQAQETPFALRTKQKLMQKSRFILPYREGIKSRLPIMPLSLRGFGGFRRGRRKGRVLGVKPRYKPSLIGIMSGIRIPRMKIPRKLTGIEIRYPIGKKYKYKRRRY